MEGAEHISVQYNLITRTADDTRDMYVLNSPIQCLNAFFLQSSISNWVNISLCCHTGKISFVITQQKCMSVRSIPYTELRWFVPHILWWQTWDGGRCGRTSGGTTSIWGSTPPIPIIYPWTWTGPPFPLTHPHSFLHWFSHLLLFH